MSTLEITEREYLIKLDRKKFNLSFVRSLLKMVEFANPTEDDLNFSDRHYKATVSGDNEPNYFSNIEEK
jgi:hypothetical protein